MIAKTDTDGWMDGGWLNAWMDACMMDRYMMNG